MLADAEKLFGNEVESIYPNSPSPAMERGLGGEGSGELI